MDLTSVLDRIRAAGVQLRAHAGKLEFRGDLSPKQIAWLTEHETELVKLLSPEPTEPAPIAWTDQPDVITVVEDLADEGMRPYRIARLLGLTPGEVLTILQRTGR